jgi:hypothetical protein
MSLSGWSPAHAQFETASVLGYVRDPSGAPVPRAEVDLINTATGTIASVKTHSNGQYEFTDVRIGQYQIRTISSGFSEALTQAFVVTVNARQRVDVALKVGNVAETVTVNATPSQLESETSSTGTVISNEEVESLPLDGRAYGDLALLVPGVRANDLRNDSVTNRDASFNVNGQRSEFNNFLLDGLDNNAYGTSNQGFSNQAVPVSPDAISEFRVETNNYSAEFGRASGAVVNVSTKSGTERYRGSLWEYNRNTSLNARGPFTPPTDAITGKQQLPVLIRNQFGGTYSGPILKNKLFFFLDYEGTRQIRANYTAVTVPTDMERQGIFLQTNGLPMPLRNPITGTVYSNGIVPMSDWTPLAKLVIAALPHANVPTVISNNFVSVPRSVLADNKGDVRLDYYLNRNTILFGRYSNHRGDNVDATSIPGPAGSGGNGTIHAYNTQIALGVTRMFTQSSILDARLGLTWTQGGKTPYLSGQESLNTQAGIPGLPSDPMLIRALSTESVSSFTAWGPGTTSLQYQNPFVLNPKLNYSILRGRNSIKLGWEFIGLRTEIDDFNPVYGQESFNGSFSSNGSGTSSRDANLADFLTGARASYQLNNFAVVNYRQYMNFLYVQDDLKPMPRLTINAGLRYELVTPQFLDNDHLSNFDPETNTMVLASSGSMYKRALVHTPKLDFAPRFGFAYQVTPKTVVRSAYGLSFIQFNREGGENLLAYNGPYIINSTVAQVAPFASNSAGTPQPLCTGNNFIGCFRTVQQGYPDGFTSPQYFNTALSQVRYIPKNIATGYTQTWHLDIQRQLRPQTVLTVSYVGEHSVKIWTLADLNQARPNLTGQTLSLLARRPIANFTAIEESIGAGMLKYNALQVKLQHRFSAGLYLLNAFTYSRAIDNVAGHLDTGNNDNSKINLANPLGDRGPSAYNQPLNETVTAVWTLPFGHHHRFGAHIGPVAEGVLGGWKLTVINTATSGQPVNLSYDPSATFDVSDLLTQRPNVTANPVNPKGLRVRTSTQIGSYLNSTVVAIPTDVTMPYGNAGRNSVRGLAFYKTDFGLHKGFHLWNEKSLLDFRVQAFNAFNHPNYHGPQADRSSSAFGTITSFYPPRQLQVAAKLSF